MGILGLPTTSTFVSSAPSAESKLNMYKTTSTQADKPQKTKEYTGSNDLEHGTGDNKKSNGSNNVTEYKKDGDTQASETPAGGGGKTNQNNDSSRVANHGKGNLAETERTFEDETNDGEAKKNFEEKIKNLNINIFNRLARLVIIAWKKELPVSYIQRVIGNYDFLRKDLRRFVNTFSAKSKENLKNTISFQYKNDADMYIDNIANYIYMKVPYDTMKQIINVNSIKAKSLAITIQNSERIDITEEVLEDVFRLGCDKIAKRILQSIQNDAEELREMMLSFIASFNIPTLRNISDPLALNDSQLEAFRQSLILRVKELSDEYILRTVSEVMGKDMRTKISKKDKQKQVPDTIANAVEPGETTRPANQEAKKDPEPEQPTVKPELPNTSQVGIHAANEIEREVMENIAEKIENIKPESNAEQELQNSTDYAGTSTQKHKQQKAITGTIVQPLNKTINETQELSSKEKPLILELPNNNKILTGEILKPIVENYIKLVEEKTKALQADLNQK